jgi:hypothetical protein
VSGISQVLQKISGDQKTICFGMMPPPGLFFRASALLGAPIADGSVFGLDGVHPCLIGRDGCGFGGAVRTVFMDWPDDFGIFCAPRIGGRPV